MSEISYKEARAIAIHKAKQFNDKPTTAYDYGNAYMFSKNNYFAIGGAFPIMVLKENGKAVTMSTYVNLYDEGETETELDFNTGAPK